MYVYIYIHIYAYTCECRFVIASSVPVGLQLGSLRPYIQALGHEQFRFTLSAEVSAMTHTSKLDASGLVLRGTHVPSDGEGTMPSDQAS